jgi:hypothetical protein
LRAREGLGTRTRVFLDTIHTGASVETGVVALDVAVVNVNVTALAKEAWCAVTQVVVGEICARATVLTRIIGTVVDVDLTVVTLEACCTHTAIVVDAIHTLAAI